MGYGVVYCDTLYYNLMLNMVICKTFHDKWRAFIADRFVGCMSCPEGYRLIHWCFKWDLITSYTL